MIVIMEVGDIRLYKERWKAVDEIEQQELRAMTLEEHWRKLNAIVRFARLRRFSLGSSTVIALKRKTSGRVELFCRCPDV